MGALQKVLSDVFTQKHRDINTRLQNKHGFKCVQRSIEHKKLTNDSRILRDNKSYFGIIKNVQYNKKDENENSVGIERLIKTTPEEVNYQPNSLGDLNFSLLEGIVFPLRSLSIANTLVGRWIGDYAFATSKAPDTTNIIHLSNKETTELKESVAMIGQKYDSLKSKK